MKKVLIIVMLVLAVSLVFAQPVIAGSPPYNSPPITYTLLPGGYDFYFPEVYMTIHIDFDEIGTYTPHIVKPANNIDAEESWIEFTGGGTGYIETLAGRLGLCVPDGTTMMVTVHIQNNQPPKITMKSSAPVTLTYLSQSYMFTTAQIRMLTDFPYFEIVHINDKA